MLLFALIRGSFKLVVNARTTSLKLFGVHAFLMQVAKGHTISALPWPGYLDILWGFYCGENWLYKSGVSEKSG